MSDDIKGFVYEIHNAGDDLLELIVDLLDLSRIEVCKMVVILESVNATSIINDYSKSFHTYISEK